jgi:hypothetical protein
MEDNQEYTDENIFVSGDKTPSAASRHLPHGGEKTRTSILILPKRMDLLPQGGSARGALSKPILLLQPSYCQVIY